MPWRRAASSSRTPTATRPSAYRRGRVSPRRVRPPYRVLGQRRPYDGRVPSGTTGCAMPGPMSYPSGSSTSAPPTTTTGFSQVLHPIYVVDGIGDVHGLLRTRKHVREVARGLAGEAGSGPSPYTRFDRGWPMPPCAGSASVAGERPQPVDAVLIHALTPLSTDRARGILRPLHSCRPARASPYGKADRPHHPVIAHYRETWNYDDFFDAERLAAGMKAYYGLCSFLDFQIGRILAALAESGFDDDTLVIYTSDHGESLGNRGLWGKSVMYEESSGVPL